MNSINQPDAGMFQRLPESATPLEGLENLQLSPENQHLLQRVQTQRQFILTVRHFTPAQRNTPDVQQLMTSMPRTMYQEWVPFIHNNVQVWGLLKQSYDVSSAVEGITVEPVRAELGGLLRRLIQEAEKDVATMQPLSMIEHVDSLLQSIERSKQLVPAAEQPILRRTEALVNTYLRAMIMDNLPGIQAHQTATAMRQAILAPQHPEMRAKLNEQGMIIAQLGGALIAVPLALFFGWRALRSENGEGMVGAGLWSLLALAAVMGPRLTASPTQRAIREVGFLNNPAEGYMSLSARYGIRGQGWTDAMEAIRSTSFPRNAVNNRNRPFTPEEIKTIMDAVGSNSAEVQKGIRAMLENPPGRPGEDFREFYSFVTQPHTAFGTQFMEEYVRRDAGPHLLEGTTLPPVPPA